jgi:DNA-binding CsgD family transcriptional regulator
LTLLPAPGFRPGRAPLVARERERATLDGAIAEARLGNAAMVTLYGDPGIGKSRLLQEFPGPSQRENLLILRGGSTPDSANIAFAPLVEALEDALAIRGKDELEALFGSNAALLESLLPGAGARVAPSADDLSLPPDMQRLRLFNAVVDLLRGLAGDGCLVLVLDDLHWIDNSSLAFVNHALRRLAAAPFLVVAAYRDGEVAPDSDVQHVLTELNRRRQLVPVPLRPLDAPATAALIEHLLNAAPSDRLADWLYHQSEGNPFFLEELIRGLIEDDGLVFDGGVDLSSGGAARLPAGVIEAVRARLRRLADEQIEVLEYASVIGQRVDTGLVAAMAARDVEWTESQLLAAVRARLLRPDPDGGFQFSHHKVLEAVYEGIAPTRRKRLHLAAAEAIQSAGAGARSRIAELAHHYLQGDDSEHALEYSLLAANDARARLAFADALRGYETALGLAERVADLPARIAALDGISGSALLSGDYQRSAEAAGRLAALTTDDASRVDAYHRLGEALLRREALSPAKDAFEKAIQLATAAGVPAIPTRLRLADLLATSLGETAAGLMLAGAAMAGIRETDPPALRAEAALVLGNIEARLGRFDAGIGRLEEALAISRESGDLAIACQACAYITNSSAWRGGARRALEATFEQERLAGLIGDPYQLRHILPNRALLYMSVGQLDLAGETLAAAADVAGASDSPEPRILTAFMRGCLLYYQGKFEEAAALFGRELPVLRALNPEALIWYAGFGAAAKLEAGDTASAEELLEEQEALAAKRPPGAVDRGHGLTWLLWCRTRLGQRDRVAALIPALEPHSGQYHTACVDRVLGAANDFLGRRNSATRYFDAAEAQARDNGLLTELATILATRAVVERSAGAPDARVRRWEHGAREVAESIGNLPFLDAILGIRKVTSRAGGLSERQNEVLRLMVEGKTNREIAAELYLTEGTVANHVTAILNKLGADNRAGAVALAMREGLVR